MEQRWMFPDKTDRETLRRLEEELRVPPIVAQILLNRHVDSFEKARRFLRPSLDDLCDPFLMADMDRAVERLARAIDHEEGIVIHGDYDVDGVSGASFLVHVLRSLGAHVSFYIPDRMKEGHGILPDSLRPHLDEGVDVLLTCDVGISAHDAIHMAGVLGVTTLITDHHAQRHQVQIAMRFFGSA